MQTELPMLALPFTLMEMLGYLQRIQHARTTLTQRKTKLAMRDLAAFLNRLQYVFVNNEGKAQPAVSVFVKQFGQFEMGRRNPEELEKIAQSMNVAPEFLKP